MSQVGSGEHEAGAHARMSKLLRTIEAEIIPRLMLAHRTSPFELAACEVASSRIGREEVVEFASLVIAQPAEVAIACVEARRADGVPLEAIYLDLVAPAARHLGELWEADLCDFTQVTLGLWRLQQVMHELSPVFQSETDCEARPRRALLVPAPGSQHTLGLFMVSEFFRRAGWDVWGEPTTTMTDMAALARAEWFDLVGLSVGSECLLEDLSSLIGRLREVSLNPSITVMVGGQLFAAHPEWAAAVGADATAGDAPQAVVRAEALLALRAKSG
jgi:methanogenic corrinoid protein MtbC1